MGVLPLQFPEGHSASSLGLTGEENFDITGIDAFNGGNVPVTVRVEVGGAAFDAIVRVDTPAEAVYYRHGGILPYMLRQLLDGSRPAAQER
jgi:aconitate hydratase